MVDEGQSIRPVSPRKEDVLFCDDFADYGNNACLNYGGDDEHGYTQGYPLGGRLLVEHVIEHRRDQDYLVYPVIFLYRHHIELALKNIIRHSPYLIDRPLTASEGKHLHSHRLDVLWQDLKPLFAAVCKAAGWDSPDSADEEGVDSYIRQLCDLDPESFAFRYPRSKKGAPSLPSELKRINLRHFAEMAERLANYLDGLSLAVSVLEEQKTEMEAEMMQYVDYYYE